MSTQIAHRLAPLIDGTTGVYKDAAVIDSAAVSQPGVVVYGVVVVDDTYIVDGGNSISPGAVGNDTGIGDDAGIVDDACIRELAAVGDDTVTVVIDDAGWPITCAWPIEQSSTVFDCTVILDVTGNYHVSVVTETARDDKCSLIVDDAALVLHGARDDNSSMIVDQVAAQFVGKQ